MKSRVGLILIGVVVCAMAAWFWPRQSMRALPDGILIDLYAVTTGTNHAANLGSQWRSSVKSILPGALARKIRPPIFGRVSAASNSLVVWFEADVDPSHSGKALGPGSRYECTLLNAEGKRLAAGSLNEIVDTSLYGDGRRLLYAVFPASTNASLTLCIQERVVNSDGTITYQHPPPVGAGLSGANLTTNGMVRFAVSNRGG